MHHAVSSRRIAWGIAHFVEHAVAVIVGLILMVVGLALGVTMIMLPVGLVVGLIGVVLVVGGLFARIEER